MLRLSTPAPPQLEEALGYEGEARFVAFHWSPYGDEADFDDGVSSGTGNWDGLLALVDHPAVARHLGEYRFTLGSSDAEATNWLLLDRQERSLQVLSEREARQVLREQWREQAIRFGPPPAEESVHDFLDLATWQEVQI